MRRVLSCIVATAALACSSKTVEELKTPEQRGEALVSDPAISASKFNAVSCTTCHAKITPEPGRNYPGAPLAGAAKRPTHWGGRLVTVAEATDHCMNKFMRMTLDRKSANGVDLYAYLASIADKGPTTAQPFTVVTTITDLPRGDATRGTKVWAAACASCHGTPHTGVGALKNRLGDVSAPLVPEDTLAEHGKEGADIVRQVVIEKIRHGAYLGFAGFMPPFSAERLSDGDVADLITYLGLYDR